MYKWHVHSAIGRGRPLANDFSRVADGIAASLRQFSVSISRAAEDDRDAPRPTRAQRGAEAAKEILATPRGIDARSLAAKPPQTFTIRRVDQGPSRDGNFTPRRRGEFSGNRGGRGGFTPRGRGGTGMRGRGGGRGARAGRARGGRGQGKRGSRPKREDVDEEQHPWTEEELQWMAGDAGGWPTPYEPKTSLEQLLGKGLTLMGSPTGALEAAMYKAQVGTDNVNGHHMHAHEHLVRMNKGNGTFFESAEAKAITQQYVNDQAKLVAKARSTEFQPGEIPTLPEAEREKLSKAWIAGHYARPEPAEKGDLLGQAEVYAKLNETYLPEDSRKLQAKLASLLPAVRKPAATQPVRKPL